MMVAATTTLSGCFILLISLAAITTQAAELIVVNHSKDSVELTEPHEQTVNALESVTINLGSEASFHQERLAVINPISFSQKLPTGTQRFAVLVIDETQNAVLYDTNDLQVELSFAGNKCLTNDTTAPSENEFIECLASQTFGGMPRSIVSKSFKRLWSSFKYWKLCNVQPPAEPLRHISGIHGQVDVLREEPLVATIRNFISETDCHDIMHNHVQINDLVMATVGGEGSTSTSESRETLTENLFVNWDIDNVVSRTAAATFDIASELLRKRVPYEGQEPINFLHYMKGFEYKPHTDGRGYNLGDRVATTLIYCETASDGGATVFPRNPQLRFQPMNSGDLLYFEYQPGPILAEHSACPVIDGKKSTLTQWHRLGVSPENPWWNFENWGEFHNPHLHTRWKGPRYGQEDWQDDAGSDGGSEL